MINHKIQDVSTEEKIEGNVKFDLGLDFIGINSLHILS